LREEVGVGDIEEWQNDFQLKVNELTGYDHLQFIVDIWDPKAPSSIEPTNEHTTINCDALFPYLIDMAVYWRESKLKFQVHLKPNQQHIYLNRGSVHTSACFKAIPNGVIKRPPQSPP